MRFIQVLSSLLILVAATTTLHGETPKLPDVASAITCDWTSADCQQSLLISGAFPSVIHVRKIPAGVTSLAVMVKAHEREDAMDLGSVPVIGGEAVFTVNKRRLIAPIYGGSSRSFLPGVLGIFRHSSERTTNSSQGGANSRIVVRGDTTELTLEMTPQAGATTPSAAVTIPLRYERWRVESGGFYTWTWARNEQLITRTITTAGAAKTQVVERRIGDRLGPSTGVTFVFYKSDYPELGLEFGTATSSDTPTSYYLGLVSRLLGIGDRVALTVSGGLSRVAVRRFPGAIPTGPEHGVFDPDDPRLAGRESQIFKPYVAIGFGVTLGGSGRATAQTESH